MEEPRPDTGNAARGNPGSRRFGALLAAMLRYFEARGVLVTVEGQEAAQHLLRAAVCGVVAAVTGFTGWLFLMVAAASYLSVKTGWPWTQVAVGMGLLNLMLASVFAFTASRRIMSTRWFEHTLKEFGKDRAWLEQLNDKH